MKYLKNAVLVLFFFSAPILSKDIGVSPDGFEWHENSNVKLVIPFPNGWHLKEKNKKGIAEVFISKQKSDKNDQFDTGFSLNYIENVSETLGLTLSQYLSNFIDEIRKTKENVSELYGRQMEQGLGGFDIRYNDEELSVIKHYFLICDFENDTLRIMSFEAPEHEWDSAWEIGEIMLTETVLFIKS